jgi:alkylation response protein AidB-like acyl-CoA dehydrogenase
MRFAVSAEQREFTRTLRQLLAGADVPAAARAWAAGDYGPGRKVWARLAELGVTSLGRADAGAHPVDLVLGFEELGAAAAPGPYVESVAVLPAVLPDADPDAIATLAAPPLVPYALDAAAADAVYLLDGAALYAAEVGAACRSVDGTRHLARVTPAAPVAEQVDSRRAVELGALATAAQILGAGRAVLGQAVAYAGQRTQFGRPIGGFQAVKHQLADAHVGLELARPLLFGAALALAAGADTTGRDVAAAKVACTDAAYRAARVSLQVHGAIGYTAEYDLSIWLTKIRALVSCWGTQAQHRARVWEAVRAR